MKNIQNISIAIIITLLLYGCVTQKLTDRQEEFKTFEIDFRSYNEKGFLFMPDPYYGEYDVLGIVSVELLPRVEYKAGKVPEIPSYIMRYFWNGENYSTQIISPISFKSLVDYVYELSVEWGGDAFTHFKSSVEVGYTDPANLNTSYAYFKISGIVIKRK
jgi:hypothetical protein